MALINASAAHKKASRQKFQELNLSEGQPKVLNVLLHQGATMQKELARKCNVEPATMTFLLKGMLENKLVRREAAYVSGGKRAFIIHLSDKGHECAERVDKIMSELEEQSFKGFDTKEKQMLLELLDRISTNLV